MAIFMIGKDPEEDKKKKMFTGDPKKNKVGKENSRTSENRTGAVQGQRIVITRVWAGGKYGKKKKRGRQRMSSGSSRVLPRETVRRYDRKVSVHRLVAIKRVGGNNPSNSRGRTM